jgi:hypothetical protein
MLKQPDQVARAEEDIIQKDQPVRWPCWRTEIRHLHPHRQTNQHTGFRLRGNSAI